MAKKIIWAREAVNDIVSIAEFIEKDSYFYASEFTSHIFEKALSLNILSNRGRIVPEILDENLREIFIGEYRLIYKIIGKTINIVAVVHGRRDLRTLLKKRII